MSANDTNDPEAVLHETRQQFIAGFQHQCARIVSFAAAPPADPEGRQAAVRLLHRMAGLAGTLGFNRVGREAARLEQDLTDCSSPVAADALASLRHAFTDDLAAVRGSDTHAVPAEPLTVLLVEDDPDQRKVTAAHLRRAGHTVVEVESGDRALAAARDSSPDLVLLDLDLPGLDGHSVCRLLKADAELASIPVVFLSAERDLNDRMAGLALGADDFLVKPIEPQELLLRLQRLHQRAAPRLPAATRDHLPYDGFRTIAEQTLRREPAAVALVRTPHDGRTVVMDALRQETRRRDVVGEYDRNHVAVLLPEAGAAAARNRLAAIVDAIRERGIAGVVAGIAASPSPGVRTLDSLFEEADHALATARYKGVAAALRSDEPRAERETPEGPIVLVGDDDPDVVRIVDAHLGAAGYRRVLSFDGAKTLEQLQVHRPAVLVLDLMMPRMTGFDVLRKMKDDPEGRPKVIVLSARGREDDVTRAFDLGADDYMAKPFNPHELVARVARLLR